EPLGRRVCAPPAPPGRAEGLAAAICAAEQALWLTAGTASTSATLAQVLDRAGVEATDALLADYYQHWDPHTLTDPDAPAVLRELRGRGLKIGVLSNTMWPRSAHERVFGRDEVLDLIDGAVYPSEIPWTKPHPEAFRAVMAAI